MKKLAIIGASSGQLPLCLKAKELGLYTICFAWEEGAICKNFVNRFYPISIIEKDKILEICKKENVDGVVSNASDLLASVTAYLADNLHLNGNSFASVNLIRNKYEVRQVLSDIQDLDFLKFYIYDGRRPLFYPCIIKPVKGASKKGVSLAADIKSFENAIQYAKKDSNENILVEEFANGKEISVESLSYKGAHYILQITEKDSSGPPHFVELGHHQPAILNEEIKNKIYKVVPQILNKLNFKNGASHIEMKIFNDKLYLIEVNPRGGGDEISRILVELSTGYDYIKGMIAVSIDEFKEPIITKNKKSGIYYLCNQTATFYKGFEKAKGEKWLVETNFKDGIKLHESSSNYNRDAYLIYCSDQKIYL